MKRYDFYDTAVSVNLPHSLQEQWDQLYGRFESDAKPTEEAVRIELNEVSESLMRLKAGETERDIEPGLALVHLQDIVQNKILSSVSSHFLFHGACWNIDGNGVVLLAESGVGKSTLSLAHRESGGHVMSDEIAPWNSADESLQSFPRSLAMRPDSMKLCKVGKSYPVIQLDEEKVIVPLEDSGIAVPLSRIIVLEGEKERIDGSVFELSVASNDDAWVAALRQRYPDLNVSPHPQSADWWRCLSSASIKAADLHEFLGEHQAILTGFHRGAYRLPDYRKSPVIEELDKGEAIEAALSHLVNARHLAGRMTPIKLMGQVRAMVQQAICFRCVPGKLDETLNVIRSTVTADA